MKQWISLILAVLLALGTLGALADGDLVDFDAEGPSPDATFEDPLADLVLTEYDFDEITIGNPTPLHGQFFTEMWGNAISDTDVRRLVAGYSLVLWDGEISMFRFDRSVVSGAMVYDTDEGDRVYVLSICHDLYFSDGTLITAWDYAFSVLLQASPLIGELGGKSAALDYLAGYAEYAAGETPVFAGVRVLTDNLIQFTVSHEALPYFYELSRLAFCPYPISAIAPGCAVYDDGEGAYIGNADPGAQEPLFTAELLRGTILDAENGYLSHPAPVSGPYLLTSYDGSEARFAINPFYKGNEAGKKPRIKRLIYTAADNAEMIRELSEGKFALLNKVTYAPAVMDGLRLCMENAQYTRNTYPRVGLTYILFGADSEPMQDPDVRRAVACFDKQQFIASYVGAMGMGVDGLYGLGQWMVEAASGAMAYPAELPEGASAEEEAAYQEAVAAWDELTLEGLTCCSLDVEEAARLLDKAGWNRNEQGQPFDPEKDAVRCKEIDGALVKLELTLACPADADIAGAMAACFAEPLAEAGVNLTITPVALAEMVEGHNAGLAEGLDMLYLGDNFNISFDPALFFGADGADGAAEGSLSAAYAELNALAQEMDRTEPHDILGYMQKWIRFQERLTELMPIIPVYSNVFFDFHTRELDEYWVENYVSWADAIVPARMRSLRSIDAEDMVGIEIELSYINGEGEIDLSSLIGRTEHGDADYSAGALAFFPENVRSEVPAEYRTIYEFVSARLDAEIEEGASTALLHYVFQTPYPEGETVYLLFGVPGRGSDVDWYVREGVGEDGGVSVALEQELCAKLADVTFALAVVSR